VKVKCFLTLLQFNVNIFVSVCYASFAHAYNGEGDEAAVLLGHVLSHLLIH
jgi:hypothetical protein